MQSLYWSSKLESASQLKSRSRPEKLWIDTKVTPSSSKELDLKEEEQVEEDLFNEVVVTISTLFLSTLGTHDFVIETIGFKRWTSC